jgi:hypothetical protein
MKNKKIYNKIPPLNKINIESDYLTNASKVDLNKSISEQLIEIKKFNSAEINESNKDEVANTLIIADVIINEYYNAKLFDIEENRNIIILFNEYQRLVTKLSAYEIEIKIKNLDEKSKEVLKRTQNIEKSQRNVVSTMISTILAVSIIPTAVAAIQNINANYILQFISTIVMLAMIMIIFVYYSNNASPEKPVVIIIVVVIAITVILWLISWRIDICMVPI